MAKVRLIMSDIDGTLVNDDHVIPAKVVTTIQDFKARGGRFVLASARPPLGMTALADQLGFDVPLVSFNGAYIAQRDADGVLAPIYEAPLAPGAARTVYQVARQQDPGLSINVFSGQHWFVDEQEYWETQEADITGFPPEVQPLHEVLAGEDPIHKVLVMGEEPDIDVLQATLADRPELDLALSRSKPTYLEITHRGVTKAAALAFLRDYFKVPLAATLAIGDGGNDLPMIQAAGVGVAMGNGAAALRQAADAVVADNNAGGVAEAINRFGI
ncbi:Cof-type HAD-IIB family hydrolase [Lacticaseibacillus thailandensis]|uniref:Hydrolase of the HAD superfamily n=1 Tax=Lacticaseibacillus thailandensis DSM 22698 = JCM 13996 TaxID=1423810 RepID=A0A0R2CII7_9LACO|nr:Cof-type HAD-IIB family hydrolase [Lacticaseibacillus thailandensis]KRM87507.1 hydrolase of the HAD superfamily [Lacticaseibacillus thailandensis DSM 22698 = JCM 13996]